MAISQQGMQGMDMHDHHEQTHRHMGAMTGELGPYSMSQEGSGTSWMPANSPHYAVMLPKSGSYDVHIMGQATGNYSDAGGKRGDSQLYTNSMIMVMAKRQTEETTIGLHLMMSADAITNGKRGYPDLFQTGETANGQPLVDRQHPHDLFSELALTASHELDSRHRGFIYVGPVGEPALGGPMFWHRPSGMENPEAPITHHWFDSTHIAFGVVTLGLIQDDKWKLDASAFNGHEPNENRYDIEPIKLDSASARLTFNPTPQWSLSASHGYLKSPEALEPDLDVHRTTASAMYDQRLPDQRNFAAALMFGRNEKLDTHSDAYNFETTLSSMRTSQFLRWENVDKDELVGVPVGSYKINKVTFGNIWNLQTKDHVEYGLGVYAGLYAFPSSLEPYYGHNPVTLGVFLRVRPERMH